MDLTQHNCIPCRSGAAPLEPSSARQLLASAPGWELLDDATKIRRKFKLSDFAATLAFVNKIGALAEAESHHPDISFGWGYCSVLFYTHKIKDLHQNDFIMAAKVNELVGDGA